MGKQLDLALAKSHLAEVFEEAERRFLLGDRITSNISDDLIRVFSSASQSYREALLGCVLARSIDHEINPLHPYIDQSDAAFSGRTLDEKVVNPELQKRRIPASRGPYLAVFRRNVKFVAATVEGLRDKDGYEAFLRILESVTKANAADLQTMLLEVAQRFISAREENDVPLARVRVLPQVAVRSFLGGLVRRQSGGRLPVFVAASVASAVTRTLGLEIVVETQGINVADAARGVAGDLVVRRGSEIILAAEVTERPLDSDRILATHTTKIVPLNLSDYTFLTTNGTVGDITQSLKRLAILGHDVAICDLAEWASHILAFGGARSRAQFLDEMIERLSGPDVPKSVKLAWNDEIAQLATL